MSFDWKEGEPPKNGRTYLLKFKGGIICTGEWRYGRFATPIAWSTEGCKI